MIRRLPGWFSERRPDRLLLSIARPDFAAKLRYFERRRPLERLGDLIQRHTAPVAMERVAPPEPFVTHEGEYGVVVHLFGPRDGARFACALGFVFGDDFYSCIEGITAPDHAQQLHAAVREAIATEELGLGIRRRRYVFRPPPWQALTLGDSIAHYFPDVHPLIDTRLSVFPAMPVANGTQPIVDLQQMLGEHILVTTPGPPSGFEVIVQEPPQRFTAGSGLSGTWWQLKGTWLGREAVARDIILLRDDVYAYAVELSTRDENRSAVVAELLRVANSIQPLPRTASRVDARMLNHWAD